MPEYLAPGVYVEEVETGAKPIEGVSTSTTGFVGVTERGPVGVPTLVVSYPDFVRKFGGYLNQRVYTGSTWYLPHAVEGFFVNGGKRLYIVRVVPETPPNPATFAGTTLFDRGDTPDVAGVVTFTRFTRRLAARGGVNDQVLLLDDSAGLNPAGSEWALVEDGRASEYVQIAPAPAGVVGITTPLVNSFAGPVGAQPGASVEALDGGGAVIPGATTTLAADVTAGEFLLPVQDAAALITAVGAVSYQIGTAPGTVEIQPIASNFGAVTISAPLTFNHNPNAQVAEATININGTARTLTQNAGRGTTRMVLDNRSGILDPPPPAPQVHFLRLTDAAGNFEFVRISSVPGPRPAGADPGPIILTSPLLRDYASGAAVSLLIDTNADISTTSLAWDSDPGDTALVLVDSTPYVPGTLMRIEAIGASNAEYSQVPPAAPAPALRVITGRLRGAHPAASRVLGRSQTLTVQAIDLGAWGNRLRVVADRETSGPLRQPSGLLRETTVAPAAAGSPTVTLGTTVGVEAGSILEFYTSAGVQFTQKVASLTGNVVGFGPGGLTQTVLPNTFVRTVEFLLRIELVWDNPRTKQEEVLLDEQFRYLSLDPRHTRYVVRVVGPIFVNDTLTPRRPDGRTEGESALIRVQDILYPNWPDPTGSAAAEAALRAGLDILQYTPPGRPPRVFGLAFTGGNDQIAAIGPATYIGTDAVNPPDRRGIHALKNIEEIAIAAVPGQTHETVQQALLDHCEFMRYRVAVLDARERDGVDEVQDHRSLYDSKYGAIYYPWLRIADPFPDNPRIISLVSIPPSGHTAGIYARTDIERGVHKAPANEAIRGGVLDLEMNLTKEEQDVLNPKNINALRNFRRINRGLRVWGARTLSSDPAWRYLNVRRVFNFVEHSIDRATQWVVFEVNDERLWARVRRTVTDFLTTVWRNGALQGTKPEEGFFVRCGLGVTMTEDDINLGRLIVEVGLAVVRPAEFVIFRIGQSRRGAELFEP